MGEIEHESVHGETPLGFSPLSADLKELRDSVRRLAQLELANSILGVLSVVPVKEMTKAERAVFDICTQVVKESDDALAES